MIRAHVFRPGGAFRMMHRFPTDDRPKYRYFFVLNRSPQTDKTILLSTTTTQLEKRRCVRPPEVLVSIMPSDYESLEKPSLIDCESVIPILADELRAKVTEKEVMPLPALPDEVMIRIHKGIAHAKTLTPRMKRLVFG